MGFAGEGSVDRGFEVGHLLNSTEGDLMRFDVVPNPFDARWCPALTSLLQQYAT